MLQDFSQFKQHINMIVVIINNNNKKKVFNIKIKSYNLLKGIQQNHRLFGGYKIFRGSSIGSPKPTKTYTNLPPHY